MKILSQMRKMAEGEGFEPPDPRRGSAAFKAAAFVHSAIPPMSSYKRFYLGGVILSMPYI